MNLNVKRIFYNEIKKEWKKWKKKTMGIHHITAIVGHPQENVDFYAGVLGLRLVKQTVNFDDPGTYHLYFGNEGGKAWNNYYVFSHGQVLVKVLLGTVK